MAREAISGSVESSFGRRGMRAMKARISAEACSISRTIRSIRTTRILYMTKAGIMTTSPATAVIKARMSPLVRSTVWTKGAWARMARTEDRKSVV